MPGAIQVSHVSSGARRDPARWRPDTMTLPLIPTAVVGSHGKPGWWFAGVKAYERGEFGPADLEEMFDDAVHAAVRDMETTGIDIITDGEVRRLDGYVDSYYAIIKGIEPVTVRRKAGPGGYDAPVNPAHGGQRGGAGLSILLRHPLRPPRFPGDVGAVLPRDLEITGPPVRAGVREPRDGRARPLEDPRRWARARRGCGRCEGLRPGYNGGRREAYPQGPHRLPGREAHGQPRLRLRLVAALHVQPEARSPGRRRGPRAEGAPRPALTAPSLAGGALLFETRDHRNLPRTEPGC